MSNFIFGTFYKSNELPELFQDSLASAPSTQKSTFPLVHLLAQFTLLGYDQLVRCQKSCSDYFQYGDV